MKVKSFVCTLGSLLTCDTHWCTPGARDALEGKWPQRRPQKQKDRRSEEAAKAVGGSYYRLRMPLNPALAVRETVAGHRLAAPRGGGGSPSPPSNASLPGAPRRFEFPLQGPHQKNHNPIASRSPQQSLVVISHPLS